MFQDRCQIITTFNDMHSSLDVGMRSSAQVLIYLDVQKALDDGIPLFLSANSVVLTPGIGPKGPHLFKQSAFRYQAYIQLL